MSIVTRLVKIICFVAISTSMVGCGHVPKREDATSSTDQASASTSVPTLSTLSEPVSTPTAFRSTAPQSPDLDNACRQTIEKYFDIPCGDWEAARALYIPSSQDKITPDSWTCDVGISKTLLSLMPASEWWRQHSDEPLPQAASPTASHEYVYFVEYTIQWNPDDVQASESPLTSLMWVVIDENGVCKIKAQGW
jgi:hypothetical protein